VFFPWRECLQLVTTVSMKEKESAWRRCGKFYH
jgi:hypothetical protein